MKSGAMYALFVVFRYLRGNKPSACITMEDVLSRKLLFLDRIEDYVVVSIPDCAMHILCTEGDLVFNYQGTHYRIVAGDYVILPNIVFLSDVFSSPDFKAVILCLSTSFVNRMYSRSNYGVIGQLLLMQNPVMKLSDHDFRICLEDLTRIRARLTTETQHLFREEMMGHLLMVHVLNLHDIHARGRTFTQLSKQLSQQLHRFIGLLYDGEYRRSRSPQHYAARLFITPHYLSEICRKASGLPATYWIDRFTLQEICRLLGQRELTLSDIASELNFSSVSYFSRYVKKRLGLYPSEYRDLLVKKRR